MISQDYYLVIKCIGEPEEELVSFNRVQESDAYWILPIRDRVFQNNGMYITGNFSLGTGEDYLPESLYGDLPGFSKFDEYIPKTLNGTYQIDEILIVSPIQQLL